MNVYFCLSEYIEDHSGAYADPPEPPEGGCIAVIVRARSRSQAKWLAWKTDRSSRWCDDIREMPLFAIRKLGEEDGEAGVFAAESWWDKVPDGIEAPKRKPYDPGFSQRDVAILGGDPGL